MAIRTLILTVLIFILPAAQAGRIGLTDARSLALGGTGVAMGSMSGAVNNPALLAYKHGFNEWGLIFPLAGAHQTYPSELKDRLKEFQSHPDETTRDRVLDQSYFEVIYTALVGAVPNTILGGSLYLSGYQLKGISVDAQNDTFDAAQPVIGSTLDKRSVLIIEHGFSVAKVFNEQARGYGSFALGLTPKIVLLQAKKERQTLDAADMRFQIDKPGLSSAFNLDLGLLREFGRFTLGMYIKNMVPVKVKYKSNTTNETETFTLYPEFRTGVAYQKRRLAWEVDAGVLANDGEKLDELSAYSGIGIEYKLFRFLQIRAGYRQEWTPTRTGRLTAGIGIGRNYIFDLTLIGSEKDIGAGLNIGLYF